jgi:hypothetical protein
MAVWQYDIYLLPRTELEGKFGSVPGRLTPDEFEEVGFWKTHHPPQDTCDRFTRWRKEIKAWTPELRWWGSEDSDRIDLWSTDGRVSIIEFRIELRRLDIFFIQLIVDLARDSDCVLFSAHSGETIEPLRERLLGHLLRSNGANEVWDWLRDPKSTPPKRQVERVFLSHSSTDKPFVGRLAIDLRAHNVPVWYDQWELKVGDSLQHMITEGIQGSAWLAVVLSPNSVRSSWVEKELSAGLALELEMKDVFVLPILIEDCAVPIFLKDKLYADFRSSYRSGLDALLARVRGRTDA